MTLEDQTRAQTDIHGLMEVVSKYIDENYPLAGLGDLLEPVSRLFCEIDGEDPDLEVDMVVDVTQDEEGLGFTTTRGLTWWKNLANALFIIDQIKQFPRIYHVD